MRYVKWIGILGVFGAGCAESADEPELATQQVQSPVMTVATAVQHDISAPLRDAPVIITRAAKEHVEHPIGRIPIKGPDLDDPVVQSRLGPTPKFPAVSPMLNFAGVGNGDYGFVPSAAPPDTNGAAGATQYVQWVNESFAVFDKTTGAIVPGFPRPGSSIWAGFGGGCATSNGDPIVQYDKAANRWILTQFSVSTAPFLQCVAVSTTSDATGSYARYAFPYANFPGDPKLGVWPDGYYITFNMFNATSGAFLGAQACAYDRSAMLAGAPATQVCFSLSTSVGGLLPSDLDGSTAPPTCSPNFLVTLQTTTTLNLFKFHSGFAPCSGPPSFTGPTSIPIASFTTACSGGGACIPQSGTTQLLDSLSDRAMYRLPYRNIGGHETLLLTHSVSAGGRRGVRWYELRSPLTGTFSVFQQGTFTPDILFRWMPSIAMDKVGNIAVGYSTSSSTAFPGIRAAVRAPTDAAGTLGNEFVIQSGGGSQLTGLSRWGDYSAMTVDPVDDCTLWFTSEYLKTSGTFNWSTKIAKFKLAGCL